MHKVDNRRRTCLPVFDPSYKPNDRRHRLPLLQQQQQQQQPHPEHQPPARGFGVSDACQKADKINRDAVKMSEDARRREKTDKKLKREKVVTWRSLNGDSKQRHSNNEESVTKGMPRSQFNLINITVNFCVFTFLLL